MRRRAFITLLGGAAAACPLAARAQQGERVRRIGVLIGVTDNEEGLARLGAFRRGLQALDWTEGRNVQLVVRFGESDPARIHAYATELVTLAPDVILANTNPAARALRDVTQTIPIVFSQLIDPVADGLVSNLAHPGGNLTGFTSFEYAMGGKWLEALKEIAPGLTRVLVIVGGAPQNVIAGFSTVIETAASQYRMQITQANVISSADIERAIQAFTHEPNGGLILLPTPVATVHLELFIALCAVHYALCTAYRRSIPIVTSSPAAACWLTGLTILICFDAPRHMSIASSRAPTQVSYLCKIPLSTNW